MVQRYAARPPKVLVNTALVLTCVLWLALSLPLYRDRTGPGPQGLPISGGDIPAGAAPEASVARAYGQIPLAFEENRGQTDPLVRFLSRGEGYSLFLTDTEAVLALRGQKDRGTTGAVLRMKPAGANPAPRVTGSELLADKVNYLFGSDPSRWTAEVPTYSRVRYEDVYPGIDMVYYGKQRQLEYDFVVAPGAASMYTRRPCR